MIVPLQHAIYGSVSGLADYRILAASEGVDDATQREIGRYSSLGGSAMAEEFDPIFSFFALGPRQWVFSRTLHLVPTTRGSDYLVHAILLDVATLARHDFKPFVFSDAGLFVREKPQLHARLEALEWSAHNLPPPVPWQIDPSTVAFLLRGLAKGPLRLRVTSGMNAVAICRAAHEALPPSDRMRTSFCTRFSYRKALSFRLAAFVEADGPIVTEQSTPGTVVLTLPVSPSAINDAFTRWVDHVTGKPELELFGPSILEKPGNALQSVEDVRQLPRSMGRGATSYSLSGLQPAAALVLRPENRDRASIRPLLPGALAIDLCDRVAKAFTAGGPFDECAQLVRELAGEVRASAAQWIGAISVAPLEAWVAKIFLMLPDAPLAEITAALQESAGRRRYLNELSSNAAPFGAFLAAVMVPVRDRFGAGAAADLARVGRSLEQPGAKPMFIGLMEAAVREGPQEVKEEWLLAIVRDIAQPAQMQNAVARLVLTYDLAKRLTVDEITHHGRAFIAFAQQLQRTLNADPPPPLIAALGSAFSALLQTTHWDPDDTTADVLRSTIALMTDVARRGSGVTPDQLTLIAFLGATSRHNNVRVAMRDTVVQATALLARVATPVQAALLLRALQSLSREGSIRLQVSTMQLLDRAARRRKPKSAWNALRRHVRLCTHLEARAS